MITTEENAGAFACPFAVSFNAGHGRRTLVHGESRREFDHAGCIGSRCMAWDWIDPATITPNQHIVPEDGISQPAGEHLFRRIHTQTQGSGEAVPAETPEEFEERLTKVRLAEGFERNEKFSVDSVSGWRKPHPCRRGQCLRVHTVAQE